MKTSLKKALSIFTAIAVMLTCITISPVSVSASEETPEVENGAIVPSGYCGAEGSETSVKWELTKNGEVDGNDTYTITIKGNGAMYDYTPDEEDPEWVTNYANHTTKIVIGYGVTRIGDGSFYGCSKAEEVVFERNEKGESSVKSIGKYAFRDSIELKGIAIPASVNSIGDYSFRACTMLTSVIFEEDSSLTTIGVQAFYSVDDVEEYILPSKVTTINDYAFRYNSDLKHFYYPSKVNEFGSGVFLNDTSLDYFGRYTVNETAKTCSVEYIGVTADDNRNPDAGVDITASEIIIPEKLDGYEVVQAKVGSGTVAVPTSFEAEHKIAKLSDVVALEGWTYEAETDELPAGGSVEVTATYHVGEEQKLTKTITVSRSACADENKDHKCDLDCDAAIGDCVDANKDHKCDYGCAKTHGQCADANNDHKCDYGCPKTTDHTYDGGVVTKEATVTEKGVKTYTCTICKATKTEEIPMLEAPKETEKPTADDGMVTPSDDGKATYKVTGTDEKNKAVTYVAPENKKATSITVPATVKIDGVTYKVTAIEKNAFKNNKKIKKVTIGKNVTNIGKNAFYGCSKLKTITIKSTRLTAKKIGSKAFSKLPKNVTVKLPKKKFKTYKSLLIKKGINKKAKFKKA